MKMKDSPICSICNSGAVDDYLHVFFQCEKVVEVGNWLLTAVRSRGCDIAPTDVLSLSLNLSKDNMYCIPWLVSLGTAYLSYQDKVGRSKSLTHKNQA